MRSAAQDIEFTPDQSGTVFSDHVIAPNGAQAWARLDDDEVHVRVSCGPVLDATVLRSYCIGAAHMALGLVRSEGIAVDAEGRALDLTMRSFGILRAMDTPRIYVDLERDIESQSEPGRGGSDIETSINGSDAVFAAVAAAAWRHAGFPPAWPCQRGQAS
jgi:CO/xanthine dehydrogenase Mo-binding subunit